MHSTTGSPNGAETLVAAVEAAGIDVAFGIPGVHNLDIFNALSQSTRISTVIPRHEEGAGYMADGYARASGRPALVVTFAGPGLGNSLTAMGTAHADSIPMLVVAASLPRDELNRGKGGLHDVTDQLDAVRPYVAWAELAQTPREIVSAVSRAMQTFAASRQRPVCIQIPLDILGAAEVFDPTTSRTWASRPLMPTHAAIAAVATRLLSARRPLILAGGGVVAAGAEEALLYLAERLNAPVLTTVMGSGCFPSDHRLSLGTGWDLGSFLDELLGESDLLLAIGTRLSSQMTRRWTLPLPDDVIHVDIDPESIGRNYRADGIIGDAREVLTALVVELGEGSPGTTDETSHALRAAESRAQLHNAFPIETALVDDLHSAVGSEGILVADMTGSAYWARRLWRATRSRSFLFPMGFGTLGFGLPAAIGAKLACPRRRVVAIVGDGGFQLTGQELATAVQYDLKFPIVLFNDSGYGALRQSPRNQYLQHFGNRIRNPDFMELARSYGIEAVHSSVQQLASDLDGALSRETMTLIEVTADMTHPENVRLG